jgi:hypothetical protein
VEVDTLYKRRRTFVTAGFFSIPRGIGMTGYAMLYLGKLFACTHAFHPVTAQISKKNLIIDFTRWHQISFLRRYSITY